MTAYNLTSIVISLNASNIFNDSSGMFHLIKCRLNQMTSYLSLHLAANQTVSVAYTNESFQTPRNFSYHCNREQELNATADEHIYLSKVQFEAFRSDKSNKFSAAKDCDSAITPDIVPIAVGISLIALIVIVLIAYIVGRRRQQARGYLNI